MTKELRCGKQKTRSEMAGVVLKTTAHDSAAVTSEYVRRVPDGRVAKAEQPFQFNTSESQELTPVQNSRQKEWQQSQEWLWGGETTALVGKSTTPEQ